MLPAKPRSISSISVRPCAPLKTCTRPPVISRSLAMRINGCPASSFTYRTPGTARTISATASTLIWPTACTNTGSSAASATAR